MTHYAYIGGCCSTWQLVCPFVHPDLDTSSGLHLLAQAVLVPGLQFVASVLHKVRS